MNGNTQNSSGESGVTVVELLVVIVIIAIVASIALMQRGSANERFKRQAVARDIKTALERARFDSVKRRAEDTNVQARVVINSTSYTLTIDKNQDGILDPSDDQVVTFGAENVVVAGHNGINLPATLTYNQRGEVTAIDTSNTINPVFYICNNSCPNLPDSDIIIVTPTGTVNLLPGTATIPTFTAPTGLTSVPPSNSINNSAVITPTSTP